METKYFKGLSKNNRKMFDNVIIFKNNYREILQALQRELFFLKFNKRLALEINRKTIDNWR